MNILIVEDERKVANFLREGLEEQNHTVYLAIDGKSAIEHIDKKPFDIILLDILLPDMNGNVVCSYIRKKSLETPVIMLTALGGLDNKLDSFDSGADDYLVKPFEFKELLARIKALSKRAGQKNPDESPLVYSDLELDMKKKVARRGGKEILLSAKEFALMELFMRNTGRVISRNEIAAKIWEITFDTGTNVVDVYINLLRKKIDRDFRRKLIHTRIGMGYVLQEE